MQINPENRVKLFDYNTSSLLLRTNPLLTGNIKITLTEEGRVFLNSINANSTLSSDRFKNFEITGKNSYPVDLYNFLGEGIVKPEVLFDVTRKTNGEVETAENFASQYDFFYGAGASQLIDKNYDEDFSYFAPLQLKGEIPEFFVIFKIPGPITYPYSDNVPSGQIEAGKKYKVVQDYDSELPFKVIYGKDDLGNPIIYEDGDFFTGDQINGTTYSSPFGEVNGTGRVILFEDLKNQSLVNDIPSYFANKILPNSLIVKTFDLRKDTRIGKYLRSITSNPNFSNGFIDFNFGEGAYTYYRGIDYRRGVYGRGSELFYDYLTSPESTSMIDFERYVTEGFSRNGIITQNILNLEFAFNDETSDDYTINRYMGFYVSRNDLASMNLSGDLYYSNRNSVGNNNTPVPDRPDPLYYYSNQNFLVSSPTGVRLYYEGATGWLPGSDDVNINDESKLYYISDRNDQLYSLKRDENYDQSASSSEYGPYVSSQFLTSGSTGATMGNIVIQNNSVDLRNFKGVDDFLGSFKAIPLNSKGNSYSTINFSRSYDKSLPLVFKIFWPGGNLEENGRMYDLVYSGDYSSSFPWAPTSFYNKGGIRVFNSSRGTSDDIAVSFSSLISDFMEPSVESAPVSNTCIIRVKNKSSFSNNNYSISVFDDYDSFKVLYRGEYDTEVIYSVGDIVNMSGQYKVLDSSLSWIPYNTFNSGSGYGAIMGNDFSTLTSEIFFSGGTDYSTNRFSFDSDLKDIIKPGSWVQTIEGFNRVLSVEEYVDSPVYSFDGKLETFSDYGTNKTAILEDPRKTIKIGQDSRISLFSNTLLKIGVFSFFDVKDFDFDFWSSDYSRTPLPESFRYFNTLSDSILPGVRYYVKRGSVKYINTVYNEGRTFLGSSGASTYQDQKASGIESIVVPVYFTDITWQGDIDYGTDVKYEEDLNNFSGFYGIESVSGSNDINSNLSDDRISAFRSGKLDTEYDYLQENYNVDSSNVSRIVPFINKWGMVGGTDSRGNQYRLNSSPAFSPTNFSPSLERDISDPMYLTHEWYLLENVPIDYPVDEINNQSNYLPEAPDYDKLRSSSPLDASYFDEFFTLSPEDYQSPYLNNTGPTREMFSNLYFNQSTGYYETIFRGVKYVIRKKSSASEDSSGVDRFIQNYRGYEGYKFSCVLRIVEEDDTIIQEPVYYEFIENNTQKFILLKIDVVMEDYKLRSLTGSTGGSPIADYLTLYSIRSKKKLSPLFISSKTTEISDIKLSSAIDLSYSSDSYASQTSQGRMYIIPNDNFDTDLREEIKLTYPPGSANSIIGDGSFSVDSTSSRYPWVTSVNRDFLSLDVLSSSYKFTLPFIGGTGIINIPAGSRSFYENRPVIQIGGGREYFDFIVNRISLGEVSKRINLENPYIKYTTYYWDSSNELAVETSNSFLARIESPSYYYKNSGLFPAASYEGPQTLGEDQPTSYIIRESNSLKSDLLRFSGSYEPISRKIIKFKSDKNDSISSYNDVDLSFRNASFGYNKEGFGIIKNLNYSKVSLDNNILSLTQNLPEGAVYPLIDQTPIDRKDFSIFYSSWDPGYYDLYTTASSSIPVAGTKSMTELKSFFGSKMMKVPYTFREPLFISLEVSKTDGQSSVDVTNGLVKESIKSINSLSLSGTGIGQIPKAFIGTDVEKMDEGIYPQVEVFWQKEVNPFNNNVIGSIKGVIRLDRILKRYFMWSGAQNEFLKYMVSDFGVGDPNSIEDDVLEYIERNIVPLYKSSSIDFYLKSMGETFPLDSYTLRGDILPKDRPKNGFVYNKEVSITRRNDLVYEFSIQLDPIKYYSSTFSFDITRI